MTDINDLPADSLTLALSESSLNVIAKHAASATAAKAGLKLDSLAVQVSPGSGGNLRVQATAVVHVKIMKAPAELDGELRVSGNGTLVIESVRLSSSNPLVAAGVKQFEGKLVGVKVEPSSYLPAGFPGLKNVQVDGTGGVLRLTASLDT